MPEPCSSMNSRRRVSTCRQYLPGHALHPIHARLLRRDAGGWWDGTVDGHLPDGWVTVTRDDERDRVRLWHHRDLTAIVRVGVAVRVCERLHAIEYGARRLNVCCLPG